MRSLFSPKPDQAIKLPNFERASDYTIDLSGSKLTLRNPPQTSDFMVGTYSNKYNIFSYEPDSHDSVYQPLTIYKNGWDLKSGLLSSYMGFIVSQLNLVTAPKDIIGSSSIFNRNVFFDCCLHWFSLVEKFSNRNFRERDPDKSIFPNKKSDLELITYNNVEWIMGKRYQQGMVEGIYLFTEISDRVFVMFIIKPDLINKYRKTHKEVYLKALDEFVKGLLSHCRLELSPDSQRLKEEDNQP